MSLKGRPVAETLTVILERQTARWTILLAASFLLLFAQAHDARLHGDALMYAGEARLIADSGEYATLRFGQESQSPRAPAILAHGLRHKDSRSYTVRRHLFFAAFRHGLHCSNRLAGIIFFGENAGWLAAIALVTCYTFLRNTTTLQMDSALTFGVLLAMVGYFRGDRSWGPPLFYGGIAVGVLAKSLPGFLPLFLAPFHALLAGNLELPWKRQVRRWLYWSPLLLLPLAWWGYLAVRYGDEVFSIYLADF